MEATVLVDIKQNDLINFSLLSEYNLHGFNEEGKNNMIETFPFKLYKKRMMGDDMTTIQIPLKDYILFLEFGVVK